MQPTRALLRGLKVLETLATSDESLGPTRVAEILDLDKATAARLLFTLSSAGYVAPLPDRTYQIVVNKVLKLARGSDGRVDIRTLARPHLERLRSEVDETVHLGCFDGDEVVYIDKLDSTRPVRLVSELGRTMPLYSTGIGKALLAALPIAEAAVVVERLNLEPLQDRTLRTKSALLADLEAARARGYSIDDRENQENVSCVGAAILGPSGEVLGAISIAGPTFRMEGKIGGYGESVRKAAADISGEVVAHIGQ